MLRRVAGGAQRLAEADRLLAVGFLAVGQLELWGAQRVGFLSAGVVAVTTASLAWRRRIPLLPLTVTAVGFVGHVLATGKPPPGMGDAPHSFAYGIAFLIVVYSVSAYSSLIRAMAGLVVICIASVVASIVQPQRFEDVLLAFVFSTVVPWLAGALVARHRRTRELARLADDLGRERDQRSREAVLQERARIARELHDVVAHGVTMMVVQAEAAEALLSRQPDRATEALHSIQRAGRQALDELRRLLVAVRPGQTQEGLTPQPGLRDLESLVAELQGSGLGVEVHVEGQPRLLARGLDLSAFRIVQEAVTNVLKHAGGARASVCIRYGTSHLELDVLDDGTGLGDGDAGHGLVGMRERVALYGGELHAGPRAEGGYAVRARLPIG